MGVSHDAPIFNSTGGHSMGNYININRSIKVNETELVVTRTFAEKMLSQEALALAKKTSNHYTWVNGKTAAVVYFELPKTFDINFYTLLPMLTNYCVAYIKNMGLNDNVIYSKFLENYKKPNYSSKK